MTSDPSSIRLKTSLKAGGAIDDVKEIYQNITIALQLSPPNEEYVRKHVGGACLALFGAFLHVLIIALDMHCRSWKELKYRRVWWRFFYNQRLLHVLESLTIIMSIYALYLTFYYGYKMLSPYNMVYMSLHHDSVSLCHESTPTTMDNG